MSKEKPLKIKTFEEALEDNDTDFIFRMTPIMYRKKDLRTIDIRTN